MEDSTLLLLRAAGVAAYLWWKNTQSAAVPASVPSEAVCTAAHPCNASVVPTNAVTPPTTGPGGMTQAQQDAMTAAYQATSKTILDYITSVQAGCPANSVLFDGKKATCSTSPIGTCPSAPYPGYEPGSPADFGIQTYPGIVPPYAGLSWCQPAQIMTTDV